MKKHIITIDGGTTNTRCILWDDSKNKLFESKREVGVRNTAIDGNNLRLKSAVKECLDELLDKANISFNEVSLLIASGMITSDVGIIEVPHLIAPADLDLIANSTVSIELPEICPLPIHFIPGIKNNDGSEIDFSNYEAMDIMRGEEVESLAIINKFHCNNPMILVLPGSHNKFVSVNEKKEITGCLTSISGELLSSITNNTIIAKSVNKHFVSPDEYDKEWLLIGFQNAKKVGLGRACFSGRILSLFKDKNPSKIANYILGASLAGDIQALKNSSAISLTSNTQVVVCGKAPLQQALVDIFNEEHLFSQIDIFEPDSGFSASALGAYLVAEKKQLL